TRNYDLVESELNDISRFMSSISTPWKIDVMKVQLQYVRDGGTRAAQSAAVTSFREMEENQQYANDPAFLSEVAQQYSRIGASNDFNRIVERLKNMPEAKNEYYKTKALDALFRNDSETALDYINEAISVLPEDQQKEFTSLKNRIEKPNMTYEDSMEERYTNMMDLFNNKRIFDPKTFFELANLAFARGDNNTVNAIKGRLREIEGEDGAYWRFIAARQIVRDAEGKQDKMLLDNARKMHRELVSKRPKWDMASLLLAEIEKAAGNLQESAVAYVDAIENGANQPDIYRELISLYYQLKNYTEAEKFQRRAVALFGEGFRTTGNMFPPPYQGFYEQIFKAISDGDIGTAEKLAEDCMKKAAEAGEPSDLIMDLNLKISKLFIDSMNPEVAQQFLETVAKQGGPSVYPLTICYAQMGKVDDAFELLLREFEKETDDVTMLQGIIMLNAQIKPSETVLQKIDRRVMQVEPTFADRVEPLLYIARYWEIRNMPEKATQTFRKILELEPENLTALNKLALFLGQAGKTTKNVLAKGSLGTDAGSKVIEFTKPQPVNSLIIRFPGAGSSENLPNPADFKFYTQP
ncbi:MAG: hypothetical protein ACRC2T_18585, partial [Thermoguttaceae bacterium]